jgi:hypothetical protein
VQNSLCHHGQEKEATGDCVFIVTGFAGEKERWLEGFFLVL